MKCHGTCIVLVKGKRCNTGKKEAMITILWPLRQVHFCHRLSFFGRGLLWKAIAQHWYQSAKNPSKVKKETETSDAKSLRLIYNLWSGVRCKTAHKGQWCSKEQGFQILIHVLATSMLFVRCSLIDMAKKLYCAMKSRVKMTRIEMWKNGCGYSDEHNPPINEK